MKYISIFFLILTSSCVNDYSRIVFKHYSSNLNKQTKVKYHGRIPNGFQKRIYSAGGETGLEHQYLYPDSSVIYISNFANSLNEQNITNGGFTSEKRERMLNVVDTGILTLNGKDQKGNYWKELIICKVSVGYINVSEAKKSIFDKALITIK